MSSILLIQADADARAHTNQIIGGEPSLAVCDAVATLTHARAAIARRVPDLIIADLRLPDGPLVNLLGDLRPGRSHVLALTASLRDPHLKHTLRHGADAYLVAGQPPEVLLQTIRLVLAGESPMAPEIARNLSAHFDTLNTRPIAAGVHGPVRLTRQEQRVLEWLGEGYLPQEIARGLALTPQQVGLLIRSVYRRMHADFEVRHGAPRAA